MTLQVISNGEEAGRKESRRLPRSKRNNEKSDSLWGVNSLHTLAELLTLKEKGVGKAFAQLRDWRRPETYNGET